MVKTIYGQPLSQAAERNLAAFKAMALARRAQQDEADHEQAVLVRKGVRVFSDEEKAAFLAARPDLA